MAGNDRADQPQPEETPTPAGKPIVETPIDLSAAGGTGTKKQQTPGGLVEESIVSSPGSKSTGAKPRSRTAPSKLAARAEARAAAQEKIAAADEAATVPITVEAVRDAEHERRTVKLSAILFGAAAVLGVIAAVLAVHPGADLGDNEAFADQSETGELIARATDAVCAPFSFSYEDFDAAVKRVDDTITGAPLEEYRTFVQTQQSIVEQSKAASECTAEHVGVMYLDGDRASILAQLIISQTADGVVTDAQTPRAQFSFVRVDGRWMLDGIGDF